MSVSRQMFFLLISRSFHSELLQYNFLPLSPAAFGSAKADQFPTDYLKSQINLQQCKCSGCRWRAREIKTDLHTFFHYVHERDQVIRANFMEMMPQSSV
ncbi:hypothetical protein V6N11_001592 [Hibiscus sabdariffa]|uniref:Uncharacterized protein n=1 Tax=Hibiscus sabdariffa TaxID=183260 RepID=A0ABR2S0Z9_9ROSI